MAKRRRPRGKRCAAAKRARTEAAESAASRSAAPHYEYAVGSAPHDEYVVGCVLEELLRAVEAVDDLLPAPVCGACQDARAYAPPCWERCGQCWECDEAALGLSAGGCCSARGGHCGVLSCRGRMPLSSTRTNRASRPSVTNSSTVFVESCGHTPDEVTIPSRCVQAERRQLTTA
jgi:hypothetical protein